MLSSEMKMLAECRWCKEKFAIGNDGTVAFKREYKGEDGRSILLTYYDCPKCGKRHFVQIDNDTSLQMLAGVSRIFARIAATKTKGRDVPARWQDKYKRHKSHLDRYRMRLMQEWSGKQVFEVGTGFNCVLEFSV